MAADQRHRTLVISPEGEPDHGRLTADEQVALWGRALHTGAAGLVEVVVGRRRADGALLMRSRSEPGRFPRAGDLRALMRLARRHRQAGEEVFCTPLTRREPRAGKAGEILPARCAWVDIDEPANVDRLRAFAPRPHLVVYSGSGGAHAFWRLGPPLEPQQLEATNRKLAHHVGADLGSTDRARIMRLPGHNHKAGRPCRIVFCDLASRAVDGEQLVAGLEDPAPPTRPPSPAELRRRLAFLAADEASRIPPPAYFRALAGVDVPERGGHVPCPLDDHHDQLASCMVYRDAAEGWWCFGCGRGGAIYDLASLLEGGAWGRDLRGQDFRELKRRVQRQLGMEPAGSAPGARTAGGQLARRPADSIDTGGGRR
jgi:RepB DNA-primase from phage plasmid